MTLRLTHFLDGKDLGDPNSWGPALHKLLDWTEWEVRRQRGPALASLQTHVVVDDVLMDLIHYRNFRAPRTGQVLAFLKRVIGHRVADAGRALRRERARFTSVTVATLPDEGQNKGQAVAQAIARALEELRSEDSEMADLLRLRLDGLNSEHISKRIGVPSRTVREKLRRGRDRLYTKFLNYYDASR